MDPVLNILGCEMAMNEQSGQNSDNPELNIFQELGEELPSSVVGSSSGSGIATQIAPLILALSSCRARGGLGNQRSSSNTVQCQQGEHPRLKLTRLRGQLHAVRRQIAQLVSRGDGLSDRQLARFVSLLSQSLDLEVQLRKTAVAIRGRSGHSSVPCNVRRKRRQLRRRL